MITTVIRGGLGNQLFQYASAYALSKRLKQPLTLDISFFPKLTLRAYKIDQLRLADHKITNGENDGQLKKAYKNRIITGLIRRSPFQFLPVQKGKYLIDHEGCFTPELFQVQGENVFLNGYFQSEESFKDAKDDLLEQLQPAYGVEKEYKSVLDEIKKRTLLRYTSVTETLFKLRGPHIIMCLMTDIISRLLRKLGTELMHLSSFVSQTILIG